VRSNLKLPKFVAGFEIDVSQLVKLADQEPVYKSVPRFPSVEQDITLKVAADLDYSQLFGFILAELKKLKGDNTSIKLEPVDIYQGQDSKDHKNITLHLVMSSYERSLTAEEVNDVLNKVAQAADTKFDAKRV